MQRAKQCARTQHRTRMPASERTTYMPAPPYTPPPPQPPACRHQAPSAPTHATSPPNSPRRGTTTTTTSNHHHHHSQPTSMPASTAKQHPNPNPFSTHQQQRQQAQQHPSRHIPCAIPCSAPTQAAAAAAAASHPCVPLEAYRGARLSSAGSMGLQSQTSSSLADTVRPPFVTRMAMAGHPSPRLPRGALQKRQTALATNNTLQTAVSAPLPRSPQQQQQQQRQQHPPPSPTPPQPLQPGVTSHSDVQRSDRVRAQHSSDAQVAAGAGTNITQVDSRAGDSGGGGSGGDGDAGPHPTEATVRAQARSEVEEAATSDVSSSQAGIVHHAEPDPLTEGQPQPPVSFAREHASTAAAQEREERQHPAAPPARGKDAVGVQPTAAAARLGVSRALSGPLYRGAAADAAPRLAPAARTSSSGGVAATAAAAAAAAGTKPAPLPRTRLSSAALASRAMPGPSQNSSRAPSTVDRGSSNGSVPSSATTGWDATPHGAQSAPQLFIAAASAIASAFVVGGGGGGGDVREGVREGVSRQGSMPRARMTDGAKSLQLTAGSSPVVALDAGNRVVVAAVQGGGLHLLRLQAGRLHPVCVVPLPMMSSGSSVSAILLSGDSTSAAVAGPMAPVVTPSLAAVNTHTNNNRVQGGGGGGSGRERESTHQHGVLLLDVANGRVVSRLQPAQGGRITKLCYSPAGSMILSASSDGSARLWDVRQRSARMTTACTIESGQGGISSLLMDLSRSWVVTGGWDGSTCAWDLRKVGQAEGGSGRGWPTLPTMVYQGHQGWVTHLSLLHHEDRLRLLTASTDWTAAVHDADSGERGAVMVGHTAPITAMHAVAEAGQAPEIITTAWDGSIAVWSLDTGACLQQHHAHGSAVCMLAKYAEDRWVTAAEDNTVRLWRGRRQDRTAGQGQTSGGGSAVAPLHLTPVKAREPCTRAVTPCSVLDAEARVVVSGSTCGAVCAWSVTALEGCD
ncbi:MAG: hypothetical protein WDW36_005290 [Sanguina aurantia]